MREDLAKKLNQALAAIDRPGTFCASGSVPTVLPGLEVEGLGSIAFPMTVKQAKELKKRCERAPYGKGEATVVDTTVRKVWRMEPGRFSLTNPDWDRFIEETVGKVRVELGLDRQDLKAHLYDLLVYEPGGFFLPHRDGEKLDRMVATLVVVLPSDHEGGEIVVRHDGQERTIDFGAVDASTFPIQFAAFYADCEHEVRPIRSGYRLCLVYNLTLAKSKKPLAAPRNSVHVERIGPILREWAQDESAGKLAIALEHQYTRDGLTWDALKGVDRARAGVLSQAARAAGCEAFLALLTYHVSGEAEYSGGRSRYGRGRWDDEYGDDDPSHYKMGEIYDSSLSAENLSDPDGLGLPVGTLDVVEDEILNFEGLKKVVPEEDFEGYTGNEGMTIERWYRQAAIFVWPEARHFAVICNRDGRAAVPLLNRMVDRWRESGAKDPAQGARCVDLASAILAGWRVGRHPTSLPDDPTSGDLLEVLAALDDPATVGRFLGGVLVADSSLDPGKSLASTCKKFGWETFRAELLAVMAGTTEATMGRNVRIVEQIASARPRKKEGWIGLVEALATGLVSAIEAIDRVPKDPWGRKPVRRDDVLAGMARSTILADRPDLLSRFVAHALALPDVYSLRKAHLPALEALQPWIKSHVKKPCAALNEWLDSCRVKLEALTAGAPREPADFRRSAPIACKCADCAELKQFLEAPDEREHRFRIKEERRRHLEQKIRDHRCDLDTRTERISSPHVLVCTKNTASYRENLKTYHEDCERLATIRAIREKLPG